MATRFAALAILALPLIGATGQDRPRFPARGFAKISMDDEEKRRLDHVMSTELDPKAGVFKLTFERPPGFTSTILTDQKGVVIAQAEGNELELARVDTGYRYRIYIVEKRRYLLFREAFVPYPYRDFPGKGWTPAEDAELKLRRAKQFTPKTMAQSFDEPHRVTVRPSKARPDAVYLLTRVDDDPNLDGKVEAQSVDGTLEFWGHAKQGQRFRVHELIPADRIYRTSTVMAVEEDYPLGK